MTLSGESNLATFVYGHWNIIGQKFNILIYHGDTNNKYNSQEAEILSNYYK